ASFSPAPSWSYRCFRRAFIHWIWLVSGCAIVVAYSSADSPLRLKREMIPTASYFRSVLKQLNACTAVARFVRFPSPLNSFRRLVISHLRFEHEYCTCTVRLSVSA
ncbi:uncharacterized protein EV422DRAFT_523373, partial [Fimicolochytrium jonesii]|uniref:uncharacterized protein n=1 Tax=Fimicolochytrium jonesii TaxID=1396493 RepID=UPI0022FEE10B